METLKKKSGEAGKGFFGLSGGSTKLYTATKPVSEKLASVYTATHVDVVSKTLGKEVNILKEGMLTAAKHGIKQTGKQATKTTVGLDVVSKITSIKPVKTLKKKASTKVKEITSTKIIPKKKVIPSIKVEESLTSIKRIKSLPKVKTTSKVKTTTTQKQKQGLKTVLGIDTAVKQVQALKTEELLTQTTTSVETLKGMSLPTLPKITPPTSPKPTPFPVGWGFGAGETGFPIFKRRGKQKKPSKIKLKQAKPKYSYAPSITSALFGITKKVKKSEIPKYKKAVFSPLDIRPILVPTTKKSRKKSRKSKRRR